MKFVLWLRKHKEVTFPQKNVFFAFSLVYVTNTVVLEKLNLYIMRHYSLFLKGNTVVVFFFFGRWRGNARDQIHIQFMCMTIYDITADLLVLSWLIKSHCHNCFQVHFRNSTHDIKYTGKNLHVWNVVWWLFSSLFFSTLLKCCTVNIYYSYKAKMTKFFTRMAMQSSFTLSHTVSWKRNGSALNRSTDLSVRIYLVSSPWCKREKISTTRKISSWARDRILCREEGTQANNTWWQYCPLTSVLGGAISPTRKLLSYLFYR